MKICVIGAGSWGKNHIRTLSEMGYLGGIVESNPHRLADFMITYSSANGYLKIEDSLDDGYDGYVVATQAETHFEIGSLLLKQRKNVLIEKPLTLSSEESLALIKLAENYHCQLMVGHLLLFHPAIRKIKSLIDSGKIGKLLYVYSTRLNFGTVRTEENVFYSFAPHDLSILNYLIGKSPISIHTEGSRLLKQRVHDMVTTKLTYPDNMEAHIFVSWLHPFKEQRLVVIGEKGMLTFDDATADKNIYFYNKRIGWEDGTPIKIQEETEVIEYEMSPPLLNELTYFIECLGSKLTIADGRSGYEVVKILEVVTEELNRS